MTITETERLCGVTEDMVLAASLRTHRMDDGVRVVVPDGAAPALATAVARHTLGADEVEYLGHNILGLPVYGAVENGDAS